MGFVESPKPSDQPAGPSKSGETYAKAWIHAEIRLNREDGVMHSDGNHDVRKWIEARHTSQEVWIRKLQKETKHWQKKYQDEVEKNMPAPDPLDNTVLGGEEGLV
jgi:hypothetical protein